MGVDPAEGVCLVANYLTANMLLHATAKVQSGKRILVHGAAGGVGSALLDLLAAGEIQPVLAERIPLAEATRAHELLERGGYAGKVVLVTSEKLATCRAGELTQ